MQSALDSAIGLPSSSTSASLMLGLLMPEECEQKFHDASSATVLSSFYRCWSQTPDVLVMQPCIGAWPNRVSSTPWLDP